MPVSSLRVLIVDESPLDVEINLRVLEASGFRVTSDVVSTVDQLLTRLREKQYDIVISDFHFHGWNGLDALRLLREQFPATPLLFVAGEIPQELSMECLKQGVVDCVRKGHLERLGEAVQNAIGLHSSELALRSATLALAQRAEILNQRELDFSILGEMDDMLQLCLNADQSYDVIGHFAGRLFARHSGLLRLVRPSSGMLESVSTWGPNPPPSNPFSPAWCLAIRSKSPSGSLIQSPPCPHARHSSSMNSLCIPVIGQSEVLGLLEFLIPVVPEAASSEVHSPITLRRRAVNIAEHFGRALINLNIRESLRTQSIHDPLTGLFNRRYLEEALDREVHRATRAHRPLGLIMLDVDHFKAFNDTHGHVAGDALLRSLGGLLRSRVREEDIACRFGGEEFLIILPEAPLEVACKRAEQLREEALHLRVRQGQRKFQPVTLSMGVAAFPKHGSTKGALLQCADTHLYLAKQGGRDRVVGGELR